MKKIILETFLGFILAALGIYVGYLYIKGLDEGGNLLLLGLSVLLIGFGIFCLYRAGKSDATVIKKTEIDNSMKAATKSQSILERNNELTSQWKKTMEQRDRLKLLQLAGDKPE